MSIFKEKNKEKFDDNNTMKFGAPLIVETKPLSPIAEEFRTIRTNIQFSGADRKLQNIAVTSAEPSEGKSTVSSNLAATFAKQGQKTLLVDGDMRRPTTHRTFSVFNNKGLSTVLSSKNENAFKVIQHSKLENLDILTGGPIPPNPAELLNLNLNDLLSKLDSKYEVIIFDTPPVNAVTDAALLAAKMDGTVLVTPQGRAEKASVNHAVEQLKRVKANILGVIMNRVTSEKTPGYYYGYGKYYGTDKDD